MEITEFVKQVSAIKEMVWYTTPERWNICCLKRGFSLAEAQNMFALFKSFFTRHLNDKDIEKMSTVLSIAQEVYDTHETYDKIISVQTPNEEFRFNFKVFWKDKNGNVQELIFNLGNEESFVVVNDIIKNGNQIISIVPQVDRIYAVGNSYTGNDAVRDSLNVFEGDVFMVYNGDSSYLWRDPEENGLYVAQNGYYRKLVYTKGRGYMRRNKLDFDEVEYEVEMDENKFTDYRLSGGHSFCRVGNIHANCDFLIEKIEEK